MECTEEDFFQLQGGKTASLKFRLFDQIFSFLANDVTLVTSYGYCQSLKINDRRLDRGLDRRCTYVRCLSFDL